MPTKKKPSTPKIPIPHWVCIGWCGGFSEEPNHCTSPGCRRNRNHYTKCECKDGKHTKLKKMYPPQ